MNLVIVMIIWTVTKAWPIYIETQIAHIILCTFKGPLNAIFLSSPPTDKKNSSIVAQFGFTESLYFLIFFLFFFYSFLNGFRSIVWINKVFIPCIRLTICLTNAVASFPTWNKYMAMYNRPSIDRRILSL